MDRTDQILAFLKEVEKFKHVERATYLSGGERHENDAEHTWHVGMFLLLFDQDLPSELDRLHMFKMILIHDLVEVYAGDTFFYDQKGRADKDEREARAMKKLAEQLPDDLAQEYMALHQEYEAAETPEAKYVQGLDKLQPILQNICSDGKAWREHDLKFENVANNKKQYAEHDPTLFAIYKKLLDQSKELGLF